MKDLSAERIAGAGLTDKNLIVYLEIERAMTERNPELALRRLSEELSKTNDRKFKEILLHRRFLCSARLNRFHEAKDAIKQMLDIEPENFYVALGESSLLENRPERVAYLAQLKERHPFSVPVLNDFAEELNEALENRDKIQNGLRPEDVVNALKRSLEIDPSLTNDAWLKLFDISARQGATAKGREILEEIVDKHLARDAYSSNTSAVLFRFCRKYKTTDYRGRQIFDYLREGYAHHFPRNYASHLGVFVDACIEFNGHHLLRPILEDAKAKPELKDDQQFASIMMNVHYDVFRDLSGAISIGREYLKANRKTGIETQLVDLYLANNNIPKAREFHAKLKGAIAQGRWLRLEAKIMEFEGRYQDAIDTIQSLPDRRDFEEQQISHLSYLELKMGSPDRAVKRCRDFLDARSFSTHFEAEIINYEYGKKMIGKSVDKRRIDEIAKNTQGETVKGVCYSLLGQDKEALALFRQESEKRFSVIDECLRWPAISRHEKDLREIRENLLKAKRSLTDLPTS